MRPPARPVGVVTPEMSLLSSESVEVELVDELLELLEELESLELLDEELLELSESDELLDEELESVELEEVESL